MTDTPPSPGWWLASDGKWYPPDLHPHALGQTQVPDPYPPEPGNRSPWQEVGASTSPAGYATFGPPGSAFGGGPPPSYGYSAFPTGAPPPSGVPPWYSYPTATASTNGLAIASLILSIISLLGIGSVIGIIFGFVSRAQIRRSGGAQKGAGLALAGIIIGFVTLSLVLLAVAIPTFLGVRASDSISVVHLAPVPITLGYPEQGGQAAPVVWQARSQPYDTTLTPAAGGVDMGIASPQQSEWAVVPVKDSYQSIQLTASVGITGGTAGNAIGLGCITPSLADQVEFLIHRSGAWQIVATTDRATTVVDGGTSAVIHDVGDNALTIACQGDLARPGQTLASFEVNGAPVASDIVDVSSSQWIPSIQLCSCGGDDTGRFTDIGYFASYDPPPSS